IRLVRAAMAVATAMGAEMTERFGLKWISPSQMQSRPKASAVSTVSKLSRNASDWFSPGLASSTKTPKCMAKGRVARLRGVFKAPIEACCCSIKMSPRNCSVKMSPPYGDIHDEQEGSPPGRAGESGLGREDHEPGGSAGLAAECAAVQAAEGALPRGWRAGPIASQPRAGVAAPVAV